MTVATKPLEWVDVDSSNVRRVAYDEESLTLAVEFNNGGLYAYHIVDWDTYQNFVGSSSVGHYLNNVIKVLHPYTKFYSEDELLASLRPSIG